MGLNPVQIIKMRDVCCSAGHTGHAETEGPMQANLLTEDAAPAGCEAAEAVSEARFVEGDLESVVGLIGLQTITSEQEYDGSRKLFLFEQLTHLDRCGRQAWQSLAVLRPNAYA